MTNAIRNLRKIQFVNLTQIHWAIWEKYNFVEERLAHHHHLFQLYLSTASTSFLNIAFQNKQQIHLNRISWNWDSKVVNWMLEVGIAITTAQDVFTNCENTLKSPGDQPKVAAAVVRLLWPNFTAVGLHCYTSTKIFLPRPNSHMAPVLSTNLENQLIFHQDKL